MRGRWCQCVRSRKQIAFERTDKQSLNRSEGSVSLSTVTRARSKSSAVRRMCFVGFDCWFRSAI